MMLKFVVAFSLVMYLGTGDDRRPVDTNLRFYNVDDCLYLHLVWLNDTVTIAI